MDIGILLVLKDNEIERLKAHNKTLREAIASIIMQAMVDETTKTTTMEAESFRKLERVLIETKNETEKPETNK